MVADDPEEFSKERRDAAMLILGGAASAILASKVGEPAWDASGEFFRDVFGHGETEIVAETEQIRALDKDYWIDFDKNVTVSAGVNHPFYGSQRPASIDEAIKPFNVAQMGLFPRVVPAELLELSESRGDIVTFGSPGSNDAIRQLMGYVSVPGDPLRMVRNQAIMHLPFEFELSKEGAVTRYSGGKTYIEPRWRIRGPGHHFTPDLADGDLKTDFLVISRLPHPGGLHSNYLLSFAGLHGPGTAATRLFLQNKDGVAAVTGALLRAGVLPDAYWQAVVPVTAIQKRNGKDIPLAIDVDGIEAGPVTLMF